MSDFWEQAVDLDAVGDVADRQAAVLAALRRSGRLGTQVESDRAPYSAATYEFHRGDQTVGVAWLSTSEVYTAMGFTDAPACPRCGHLSHMAGECMALFEQWYDGAVEPVLRCAWCAFEGRWTNWDLYHSLTKAVMAVEFRLSPSLVTPEHRVIAQELCDELQVAVGGRWTPMHIHI